MSGFCMRKNKLGLKSNVFASDGFERLSFADTFFISARLLDLEILKILKIYIDNIVYK